jgi:Ran GTPase-activating protein (RanGAP) involved in mRNA processing and transport
MDGLELKALSVLSSPSYPKSPLSKGRGRSQVQFIGSLQELNETVDELSIRPKRSDEHFGIRFYAQNVSQMTITRLAEVIPMLGNIVVVDLACCGLDDVLCQSMCLSLERSARSVRQLLLGGNRIGNDGARFVGQYAKKNRVLTEINLRFNLIGSAGAASLAASLRQHPRLESFNLSSNQVGSKGCAEIASAMSKCPALRRLELFANRIGVCLLINI